MLAPIRQEETAEAEVQKLKAIRVNQNSVAAGQHIIPRVSVKENQEAGKPSG
jgi:hypothetical protein